MKSFVSLCVTMSLTAVLKYALIKETLEVLPSWIFLTVKSYSDNNEKHSYLTLTVKIPAINEKLCDIK